jgi:hypothetical protein
MMEKGHTVCPPPYKLMIGMDNSNGSKHMLSEQMGNEIEICSDRDAMRQRA